MDQLLTILHIPEKGNHALRSSHVRAGKSGKDAFQFETDMLFLLPTGNSKTDQF